MTTNEYFFILIIMNLAHFLVIYICNTAGNQLYFQFFKKENHACQLDKKT